MTTWLSELRKPKSIAKTIYGKVKIPWKMNRWKPLLQKMTTLPWSSSLKTPSCMDTVQEDRELATFYVSYQDARRRLLEKSRSRGFWPVKTFKGNGKKGKVGKGGQGKSKGLAHRIANSSCRLCGQTGHWKAECPSRKQSSASEANQVPTSFVIDIESCLRDIPEVPADPLNDSETFCLVSVEKTIVRFREKLRTKCRSLNTLRNNLPARICESVSVQPDRQIESVMEWSAQEATTCFASSGSIGVVDLGASQTVIGSNQVPDLLANLPDHIRKQVKKTSCNLVFRFGNHRP